MGRSPLDGFDELLDAVAHSLTPEGRAGLAAVLLSLPTADAERYIALVRSSTDLDRFRQLTVWLSYAHPETRWVGSRAAQEALEGMGFQVKVGGVLFTKVRAVSDSIYLPLLPFTLHAVRDVAGSTGGSLTKWRL